MADIPHLIEKTQVFPDLDIKQYDHWRDWLFNLQLGHTELPGIKDSYNFGHAAYVIGQGTIAELREAREKDGQPYMILSDEKTDGQVLCEATPEDRRHALVDSVLKHLRGWVTGDTDEEKQYYSTSALALGSAILEVPPENVRQMILEKIETYDTPPLYKDVFKKLLNQVDDENIKRIKEYLGFSQTQMTNKENYFMQTGLKEPPPIWNSPLIIGENTYEFESQPDVGGTFLPSDDENVLIPLMEANHRGRQDMIN